MRAFLITSPKFSGSAEVRYNAAGVLCFIDATHTDLDAQGIAGFKSAVAPHIDNITDRFTADTVVVETGVEITFEQWFNKYNYKLDKKRAQAVWDKLSKGAHVKCYYGVEAYDRFLKRKGGKQEKLYPKTYLSSEAYETDWDKIK